MSQIGFSVGDPPKRYFNAHRYSEAAYKRLASRIRQSIVTTVAYAGGGHLASSLSVVEILIALYYSFMRFNEEQTTLKGEHDLFVLSSCQCTLALYATLLERGCIDSADLKSFLKRGSSLAMFASPSNPYGSAMTGGSLGHGLAFAAGLVFANRKAGSEARSVVLIGDGELNEGSIWEAAMAAAQLKLGSLQVIVNRNRLQIDGPTESVMALEPISDKWRAFGWEVAECNGHSVLAIARALRELNSSQSNAPKALIAHTVKGKGVSFMQERLDWHYRVPTDIEVEKAVAELRLDDREI